MQLLAGGPEAFVIVPDANRDGLAQHWRDCTGGKEEVAVEIGLRHRDPVLPKPFSVDQNVRLKIGPQQRQVQSLIDAIRVRDVNGQRV